MFSKTVQVWKCYEMENKYLTNMATMLPFIRMMEKSLQLDLSYHDLMQLLILSKKSFYNKKEIQKRNNFSRYDSQNINY